MHLLLLTLLVSSASSVDPGCFSYGECTKSLFLSETYEARSPQSCLEECRADQECAFFNYYHEEYL